MSELKSRCCGTEVRYHLTNLIKKPVIRYCAKCEKELNPLNQPIEIEKKRRTK